MFIKCPKYSAEFFPLVRGLLKVIKKIHVSKLSLLSIVAIKCSANLLAAIFEMTQIIWETKADREAPATPHHQY